MIRILIAEDEAPIANLVKLSLKKAGYLCDCASDGEEAAEKIGTKSYDLILLDVMLPKIDGFELMEYIRPMRIPVIFLTAKNAVSDRVKGLRMGAEDYIVKPFEIVELAGPGGRSPAEIPAFGRRDPYLRAGYRHPFHACDKGGTGDCPYQKGV